MKFTTKDLKEIAEVLEAAEKYRPAVHAVMQVIDSYGPELAKYPKILAIYGADLTTSIFKRYVENGFSREEALLLTINQKLSLKESFKRARESAK